MTLHGVGGRVASPCISVCVMDAGSGVCVGCMRTLDEIAAWGELADLQKRAIWKRLPARRAEAALRHAERTPP